jgi:plasmid stability protein
MTLYIRRVPVELHRALKVRAAEEGKQLQELCLEMLAKGVGRQKGVKK